MKKKYLKLLLNYDFMKILNKLVHMHVIFFHRFITKYIQVISVYILFVIGLRLYGWIFVDKNHFFLFQIGII